MERMTEKEAKYTLIEYRPMVGFQKYRDALNMAIQALEEIQAYRAIGTVEELKTMKENGAFSGVELAQIAAMQMKLKEYQAIGTVEEFKTLKDCVDCSATVKWIGKNRIIVNDVEFVSVRALERAMAEIKKGE